MKKNAFMACERYCLVKNILSESQLSDDDVYEIMQKEVAVEKEFLEDICDGCKDVCFGKEISSRIYNPRFLAQMRCVDDYKWVLGEEFGREVSSEEALTLWIKNGYAKSFAEVWEGNGTKPVRHWNLFLETGERATRR